MASNLISTRTRAGDYYGLATGIIESENLRVEFLTESGPSIVRLQLAAFAENLFAETPDISWETNRAASAPTSP